MQFYENLKHIIARTNELFYAGAVVVPILGSYNRTFLGPLTFGFQNFFEAINICQMARFKPVL